MPVAPAGPCRRPGRLRGKVAIGPEFFGPLPEEELAAGRALSACFSTQAFLWWVADDPALSVMAREAIAAPAKSRPRQRRHSVEIAIKYRIGKLPAAGLMAADVAREIAVEGFAEVPVTVRHAQHVDAIPGPHKDPFDRMLIAQALAEGMALVSNEACSTAMR